MIRFACPGCGAVFTVEDAKGGKAGKCPKCQARFSIPASVPPAAPKAILVPPPAPPPVSPKPVAPPPPPSDPAAPVEITPCPGCQGRLSVAATDLGRDIECPYCKLVYRAERASDPPPASPKRTALEDLGGSRRSQRLRDEDDRPSRRRRRDEDDDDEDDRPRRRPRRRESNVDGNKRVMRIISAILSLLLGVGWIGCGILLIVASTFILGMIGAMPPSQQNPQGAQQARNVAGGVTLVIIGCGVGTILFALLYILAGVGALMRKGFGRVMTIICAVLSSLMTLLQLFGVVMSVLGGDFGDGLKSLVGVVILGGHAVVSFMACLGDRVDFE